MPHANQENPFDPDRYRDAEAQLGGADDVEKTTYVLGQGTRPERRRSADRAAPGVRRGGGSGLLIAIVVGVVAVMAIVYLVSMAR